ncbi:RNA ligase family protein [Achromobacter sp. F4_2707]|uniref:RNA ligase family protein n=1 Tax=Achromobacter sp. F4_2707 TaxID=3114286 RepID=UPI0039C5CC3A
MTEFFRFPQTPHIAWLGEGAPRDDKLLTDDEIAALLENEVVAEEKLDGANVGFSLAPDGSLRAQNRGQYLIEPYVGQFSRLPAWTMQHGESLKAVLNPDLIIFGEWCAARHSLDYATLPDWFMVFDVYDRKAERFWSTRRRNALAAKAGLVTVPHLFTEKVTVDEVKQYVEAATSRFRPGPLEGLVLRSENDDWCLGRAKLVRHDFTQAIDVHWRKRAIEWNRLKMTGY